jgi:hypothetical protein
LGALALLTGPLPTGDDDLTAALRRGDTAAVRQALQTGLDPDAPLTPEGLSPLHVAAQAARPHVARLLLAAGAAVDPAADPSTPTPLLLALQHARNADAERRQAVLRRLLAAGAEPQHKLPPALRQQQADPPPRRIAGWVCQQLGSMMVYHDLAMSDLKGRAGVYRFFLHRVIAQHGGLQPAQCERVLPKAGLMGDAPLCQHCAPKADRATLAYARREAARNKQTTLRRYLQQQLAKR